MLETVDILFLIVSALGAAQAIFLIVLLMDEEKRGLVANRWLMVFSFSVGMSFVDDILDPMVTPLLNLYLVPVFAPFFFVFFPSIYLYFCEISGVPASRPYRHFLVLFPVTAAIGLMVYLKGSKMVIDGVPGRDDGWNVSFSSDGLADLVLLGIVILFCISFIVYMVGIWQSARHYRKQMDRKTHADSKQLNRWVTELFVGMTILFSVFTLTNLFDLFILQSEWLSLSVKAAFVLVFFRMCQVVAQNPTLFVPSDPIDAVAIIAPVFEGMGRDGKPLSPRVFVDNETATRIRTRLEQIVTGRDTMFDPLLTMPKLAAEVGVSPNQLSFVLNRHMGKSFFDFVNQVRIEKASRLLVGEPDRTILDIATSVGFNSKSTFNQAFKKVTGMTPSAYRQKNPEKITI